MNLICFPTKLLLVGGILVLTTLISCSEKGQGPESRNQIPESEAIQPLTVRSALHDGEVLVRLSWDVVEEAYSGAEFDLYTGTDSPPLLLKQGLAESTCTVPLNLGDTVCFWRVVAKARSGQILCCSPIWRYDLRPVYQYPLGIGRTWSYDGAFCLANFDPDSLEEEYGFVVERATVVEVAGTQNPPNGPQCLRLHETMTEEENTYESDTFFKNEKRGLFYYGHYAMSFAAPLKVAPGLRLVFKGRTFDSMHELNQYFFGDMLLGLTACTRDTVYHDPPLQSLAFPPQVGTSWNFRPPDDPWLVDKQVVATGPVTVPAGTFDAFEVLWLYDIDGDGVYDEDIHITDQISYSGLLSRTAEILGLLLLDYQGDTLGTFDAYDTWELTELSAPESDAGLARLPR